LSEFTEPEPDVTAEMRAELADAPRRYGTEPAPIEFVRAGVAIVKTRKSDASLGEMNFDFQNEYEGQLTIDVYQDKNDIIVESTVAGVNPSNLDIAVTNESVNIRGERRRESEAHDRDFFYRECYWGKFARLIILPQNVDPDRAQATLKNGVLTIRLPKTGEQETKRLKVQFS
jgi:HSP20 family protein